MKRLIFLLAFLMIADSYSPSVAQVGALTPSPKEACADPDLKGTLTAWSKSGAQASAAHDMAGLTAAKIAVGARTKLALPKDSTVKFVTPPRPDMPKEFIYAGLASFMVPKDGTYRVAVVEGLWIEVMQEGNVVKSTTFGKGPECTGKHVDFPLKAGVATLQLSGGPYQTVDVLIVPLAN